MRWHLGISSSSRIDTYECEARIAPALAKLFLVLSFFLSITPSDANAATACEPPPVLVDPLVYQNKCPGDAGFPSIVSAGGRDVSVNLPKDRRCTKRLQIKNARNVHIVGGSIVYNDAASSAIDVQSSSGTAFIEGMDIDTKGRIADSISSYAHTGRVVIQNTSIRGVAGSPAWQIRAGVEAKTGGPLTDLKLQNVTLRTGGRGLFAYYSPSSGHGTRKLHLDQVDAAYDSRFSPWPAGGTPPRLLEIGDPARATYQAPPDGTVLNKVYVDGSAWNIEYDKTVFVRPSRGSAGCAGFNSAKFTGEVCLGPPPEGDFAPASKTGLNYDRAAFCEPDVPPPTACDDLELGISADLAGMRLFPVDDPWNTDISALPVHPLSEEIKASMGDSTAAGLRAEFGSGAYNGAKIGIPYIVVPDDQPPVPIVFWGYGGDDGPYPVPPNAPVEGAGLPAEEYSDNHVLVVQRNQQRASCLGRLYELFRGSLDVDGDTWQASSGAFFDLNTPSQRPAGSTTADAAGLPIFPGLVRYDEVQRAAARKGKAGVIPHAFRFTVSPGYSKWAMVSPATHCAGWNAGEVPFGSRWRLRQDWPIEESWPVELHIIINTLKKYGMIMADNGGQYFITGAPDERWNNDWLRHLAYITGNDLEMVNTGEIMDCTP